MLRVFGHFYSDNKENFDAIASVLEEAGYQIAYDYPTNATIIKEIVDEQEDTAV